MEQDDDAGGAKSMQDGDMKTWMQVSFEAGINWDEAKNAEEHKMLWVGIDEQKEIAKWADEYEDINLKEKVSDLISPLNRSVPQNVCRTQS